MNTDDYVQQCLEHLTDSNTYQRSSYSSEHIEKQVKHVLLAFKSQLVSYDKRLFTFLYELPRNVRLPRFYGLPKVHKPFVQLPPVHPIISQSSSLLAPIAKFTDHLLQPIANTYPDYLSNSTSLLLDIQDLHVPDDAILVTMDVNSLYPSIPQTECLELIYNELHEHSHLLLFDPNLIIQLLHINVNNTFFTFGDITFKQIKGTAMGAPFSPTMANIYMSVTIKKFLLTQKKPPHFLKRYIDDIIMVWTGDTKELNTFLTDLNRFNANLSFSHQHSMTSIDFLDLTVYKGPSFYFTNVLDFKTFQKERNPYQYLHFTSEHPKHIFKALIKGECIRYVKTSSNEEIYNATVHNFQKRLLKREYPTQVIQKITATVKYKDRERFLRQNKPKKLLAPKPPLYKFTPPPQFKWLKQLALQDYGKLRFTSPRFVSLKHPTLQNKLVRSQLELTDSKIIDETLALEGAVQKLTEVSLPRLKRLQQPTIEICSNPRCITCRTHLTTSPTFKANYHLNRTTYQIRHSFTCQSNNVRYT